MTKEEKNKVIDSLAQMLKENPHFYLADTTGLTVEKTNKFRRHCYDRKIKMLVVKNTLLRKAMEKTSPRFERLHDTLKSTTAVLFSAAAGEPAKVIKEFRKNNEKPVLKSAFVEEEIYIGHNHLDALAALKSKNEIIADIVFLLQSPAKNVISALLSGKNKIAGLVKTLEEKKAN
jgi:large subunit ribosomal protein L10